MGWRRALRGSGGPAGLLTLLLAAAPAAAGTPIEDLARLQDLLAQGDHRGAREVAARLAASEFRGLFRELPDDVLLAEAAVLGDPRPVLELYRSLAPQDGCLVSQRPTYWNSCARMAELYGGMGDRAGRIEMLRRLAHGAGLHPGRSPSEEYLDLAEAYEDLGEEARAADYYRTVIHTFDDRRCQRRSREALGRVGEEEGEADAVILGNALSRDDVLRRAGRLGLGRLLDPPLAFDLLLDSARAPALRDASLDALVALPLADLDARLRDLLHSGEAEAQGLSQDALRRTTGLSYPFLDLAGDLQGGFDDLSPFTGLWGAPYLLERLEDPYESEAVRLMALDALGHAADLRGLEAILQRVRDRRPAWRAHALHALRGYGGLPVEEALVGRLQDDDPLVRLFAAAGIARRRLPDAADLLSRALTREDDPLVAAALVEALALQGGDGAADALLGLARRLAGPAAAKAGEALLRLGDDRGIALLEATARGAESSASWARAALAGADRLRREGPGTTPLLDRMAPPSPIRAAGGAAGPDASAEEIVAASVLGFPPPATRIGRLLESSRWSEYRGAAVALANAGLRSHLNAIRRRARVVSYGADGSENVLYEEELLEALGLLHDDAAAPLLREALASRHARSGVRAAAARSLGRLGDEQAVGLLLSALGEPRSPERLRRASAWALARVAGPELGPLIAGGLEAADANVRRRTLQLLHDVGAEDAWPAAARIADMDPDPEVRAVAALVARPVSAGGP